MDAVLTFGTRSVIETCVVDTLNKLGERFLSDTRRLVRADLFYGHLLVPIGRHNSQQILNLVHRRVLNPERIAHHLCQIVVVSLQLLL